ncbi:hypothetical protein VTK73DRAFT_7904 [Phialemonium thermophilum]|uniref:Glutathione S-transferase n=1 Tax=Phialemonium thermophilum TaxID=223376 RepID=A0ABR3WBS2_9PEZI
MAIRQQPKIRLFWLNQSRAQSIVWLLEELGLNYELVVFQRTPDMFAPPELEKIHPLGKSPLVGITPVGSEREVILAESGFIVQYLAEHFGRGKPLLPTRYQEGKDGEAGGETEEWLRYQYLLYYAEGSLMPYNTVSLILSIFKSNKIPLPIRPIASLLAGKMYGNFVRRNMKKHFSFLESQLGSAPQGGPYLCGPHLTAADILLSYPLLSAKREVEKMDVGEGKAFEPYPRLRAYVERIQSESGYKKAVEKVKEFEGKGGNKLL